MAYSVLAPVCQTYWCKNTVGHSVLYMYRVILTAPNLSTYMLSVSCTVAYTWHAQWYSNQANSRGVQSEEPWTQYTCSKTRIKLQNIAYKTSKIVCGPNPTGRAYTAPSHHLVSCMGIAIHIPPPLSRPLPYVQCVLPKQRQNRLRTRNMVTSHAVASKLPTL